MQVLCQSLAHMRKQTSCPFPSRAGSQMVQGPRVVWTGKLLSSKAYSSLLLQATLKCTGLASPLVRSSTLPAYCLVHGSPSARFCKRCTAVLCAGKAMGRSE